MTENPNIKDLGEKRLDRISGIGNEYNYAENIVRCVEIYGKKFAYTISIQFRDTCGGRGDTIVENYNVSRLIPID